MLLLRSHHLLLPHAARLLARRASPLPRAAAAAPRLRPLRMSTSNSSASASSPAAPSPTPVATALTSQGPCGPSYQLYLASSGHPLLSQITVPKSRIPFCPACGSPTKLAVPDGDEKMRAVCSSCGRVHYENPKMVVGCLVEHDNKVLLCRRKIEPAYGLWTLPAGYLEVGESAAEGASRETLEEACADVEIVSPFAQLDIPLIGQSYIIFRAKMKSPNFSPGAESLECALFALDDIPFDSLAFSSIIVTLRMYIEDVKSGNIKFHYCTINKRIGAGPSDLRSFDIDNHLAV